MLCFRGLFVRLSVSSTCCDITRASPATVIAFDAALSSLIPSIIIVVLVVLYHIGFVSLMKREITWPKVEKALLNLGTADSMMRAGA